jgi:hypothetical protein
MARETARPIPASLPAYTISRAAASPDRAAMTATIQQRVASVLARSTASRARACVGLLAALVMAAIMPVEGSGVTRRQPGSNA